MKRAAFVGLGTVAGVAALLGLNPDAATLASSNKAATTPTSTTPTTGTPSASTPTTNATPSASASPSASSSTSATKASGTYTGTSVDVGRGYGSIQLQVTVTAGKITAITALATPQNDPRSSSISSYVVPVLTQQAISAQSANISGVSGATYTSYGFAQSLQSALVQAGLA